MKSKRVLSAILALTLASSGFAYAQGNSEHNDRGDRGREDRGQRAEQRDRHDDNGRQQARREDRGNGNRVAERHDERGAGPEHNFHRGSRLPVEYRSRQYVVDDWRGHHLSAPPRGYHWVQTGGDFVLVAITTGIILQLLLNN